MRDGSARLLSDKSKVCRTFFRWHARCDMEHATTPLGRGQVKAVREYRQGKTADKEGTAAKDG
jgi:hypothetical protein